MTFFSRCEAPHGFKPGLHSSPRRTRTSAGVQPFSRALLGFFEDLGILARYAAGLDYYGRDKIGTGR